MTQPLDIISGALLDIGARAAGETAPPEDVNEAFIMLNQMLDSWSNESMMVFYKQEVIHEIIPGQYVYTIGPGGYVGATVTGSIAPNSSGTGGVLTVTNIASGALSVGMTLSGTGITSGTAITSLGTGLGGNGTSALGTYNLNLPQTVVSGTITLSVQRPLKINSGFVRVVNSITGTLDYPIGILNLERYEQVGIKTLPGPWPRAVYYQPSEPVGVLNYWPNPAQGEMHLFVDSILNRFNTVNDNVILPPGFEEALRANLAFRMMPSYGKTSQTQMAMIEALARKGKGVIKKSNMVPIQTANFDSVLVPGMMNDAGFILHGGFR